MAKLSRRGFVSATGALAAAALSPATSPGTAHAAAPDAPLKFRLGIVTYMIAADWDVPTILRVLKNVGITDVELRTTDRRYFLPFSGRGIEKTAGELSRLTDNENWVHGRFPGLAGPLPRICGPGQGRPSGAAGRRPSPSPEPERERASRRLRASPATSVGVSLVWPVWMYRKRDGLTTYWKLSRSRRGTRASRQPTARTVAA